MNDDDDPICFTNDESYKYVEPIMDCFKCKFNWGCHRFCDGLGDAL